MSTSSPTDDLRVLFRETYQVVVDNTTLPGDDLPTLPIGAHPTPRRRGPVIALAAGGLVLALGGLALLTRDPNQVMASAERLALVEAPAGLGGTPVVQSARVSEPSGIPTPAVEMWIWTAPEGTSPALGLFEAEIGDDLGVILGTDDQDQQLVAPEPGEVEVLFLPGNQWHATSWVSGDRWRIAVGFDESEVARVAETIVDQDPSTIALEGMELAYQGPQLIQMDDRQASALFYESPSGDFGVTLVETDPVETLIMARLLSPDLMEVEVNGIPALSGSLPATNSDSEEPLPGRVVLWPVGEDSTAFLVGFGLSPELMHEIAEGVEPVSVEEWQSLAETAPTVPRTDLTRNWGQEQS